MLIDYVSQGMDCSSEEWDSLDWTPQIWSTLGETRERAPPAARSHIVYLKDRANNADAYIRHMKAMPSFQSRDALSTITEPTRQEDDDDESVDSFSLERNVWNASLKKHLSNTIAKHEAEGKAKPKEYGVVKKPKGKAKTKAGASSSGASSSK